MRSLKVKKAITILCAFLLIAFVIKSDNLCLYSENYPKNELNFNCVEVAKRYEIAFDYLDEAPLWNANGYYEISNANHLFWFVSEVNSGNSHISAKLISDIVVNENLLEVISVSGQSLDDLLIWTPIVNYYGTFDGNYKKISGLYFNDTTLNSVGLFGFVGGSGIVKNLGIVNSYFIANQKVGGVVGSNEGLVENCFNSSFISGSKIVGENYGGRIENCYSVGTVASSQAVSVGGIAGKNRSGIIRNCYYLENSVQGGTAGEDLPSESECCLAERFSSGEIAYRLGSAWGQLIGVDTYPTFKSETNSVYRGYLSCSEKAKIVYSNDSNISATKLEHTGGESTCIGKRCENCGELYGKSDENAHLWNEGILTKSPNCSDTGVKIFNCVYDESHTYIEEIEVDKNAHSWNDGVVTKKPNCKEKGEKTFTCMHDLTHTYTEEIEIDENAHEFGAWQVEKPATTENDGTLAHKECIICNKHFDYDGNEIEDLTIPKIQNSNCDLSSDFVVDEKSLTCGLIISFLVIALVLFLLIFKKKSVRS